MAGHKGVVNALRWLGEAGQPAQGTQSIHGPGPAGQKLVGVALMAHVKDQSVPLRAEYPVDGHDELHRSQTGGQVAAGTGDRIYDPGPQQLAQGDGLAVAQAAQIPGNLVDIENG